MSMDSNPIRRSNIPGISYPAGEASGVTPAELRKAQVNDATYHPKPASKQPPEHPKMPEEIASCPQATVLYLAAVGRAIEYSLKH